MRKSRRTLQGLALAAVVICSAGAQLQAQQDPSYVLATGTSPGQAHAVAVCLATLADEELAPTDRIEIKVIESEGYVDNIRLLQENRAQFAILQAMFGHFERTGTGTFMGKGARDDIRAIAQMWRDADHVVMYKDYVQTGTIEDILMLKGQRVALGPQGPGPLESNRLLLAHLGVDIDQAYDLEYLNYRDSARALQNGEIAAMSTPIRPPGPHIAETLSKIGDQVQILEFKDEQLAKADGGLGLWTNYTIPAGTYPGQDRDIMTVGKSNLLVARTDVDEQDVYRITKMIFENLEELYDMDEAMREVSFERALTGLTIPLHPGALRYYKEVGMLPPDATIDSVLTEMLRARTVEFAPNGAAIDGLGPAVPVTTPAPAETSPPREVAALNSSTSGDQAAADAKQFLVYFDIDRVNPSRAGTRGLTAAASFAEQSPFAEILVAGHADRSGGEAYNARLAQLRAEAVATALREHGIPAERIRVTQYGETAPAVPTDDDVYEALNRRVEITFKPSDRAVARAGLQRMAD